MWLNFGSGLSPCELHVLYRVFCELRKLNAAKVVNAGPALRVKHCLQMPVYSATLQHIPAPMQESVILTFGRQLKTSLQSVHQKGYGHNDVKAANIFISATGTWAARYNTWHLIKLTPKGVVFSFLCNR